MSETRTCCSVLLVCLFGLFVQVRSEIRILLYHVEGCRVYWFYELGSLWSPFGEISNLRVLPGCIGWFGCVCYSDCYILVKNVWHWVWQKLSQNLSFGTKIIIVFHFDWWSTQAVLVFVVIDDIVRVSSVRKNWGLAHVSFAALLICIVKWWRKMRPCVVSMTTLSHGKQTNI